MRRLCRDQAAFLADYWRTAAVQIDGHLQQGMRFNSSHLLQGVGRDSVMGYGEI